MYAYIAIMKGFYLLKQSIDAWSGIYTYFLIYPILKLALSQVGVKHMYVASDERRIANNATFKLVLRTVSMFRGRVILPVQT